MTLPKGHLLGILLATVGVLILSPDGLLVRLLTVDGWTIVFWRGLLLGLTLSAVIALRNGRDTLARFREIGRPGLLIAVLFGAASSTFIFALLNTTVANAFVITSSQPLIAAVLSRWLLAEPVSRRTWIATLAVFAGIAVIFAGSLRAGGLLGDMFALLTALLIASKMVVIRHARTVNMVPALALGGFIVAAVVAPLAAPLAVSGRDAAYLLLLGLVILPLSFSCFTLAPRYLPVPEVSLILLGEAVLGPLWVWLVVAEAPAAETFLGGALILGTLALYFAANLGEMRGSAAADRQSNTLP